MTTASSSGNGSSHQPKPPRQLMPDAITIPAEILTRHRARVLDPTTAVKTKDGKWPLSTVYRSDVMLVPAGDVRKLRDSKARPAPEEDINGVLGRIGLELRPPRDEGWNSVVDALPENVGVPVPLKWRDDQPADRAPDPWAGYVVLQDALGERVANYGLDHLLMPASITVGGAPVAHGPSTGTPVAHGPSVDGGIVMHTGDRNPVAVLMPKPVRPKAEFLPGGRRPVVAVLDTGIGPHPWWDDQDPTDPIYEVSQDFQDQLASVELGIGQLSPTQPSPLSSPFETQDEIDPLLGLIDAHSGHGTFVSGLVHQLCPAAKILSLRVLHSDGFSTESAVVLALNWLLDQVANHGRQIDVVSMSLGFYAETATVPEVQQVRGLIEQLTGLGVLVVSAAGNDATTRPFMPAAFARGTGSAAGGVELLGAVGARNAAGDTTAAFSNWGEWITLWAPGDALVSTVPVWEGAAEGGLALLDGAGLGPDVRTAPDPDDLRTGFAVWAGTSFATPVIAGMLANALTEGEMLVTGESAGVDRARGALKAVNRQLVERGWKKRTPVLVKRNHEEVPAT
ncbi:S8 family peptidase [Actinophytocola oryzae]|uniref:Subtilase family protein n=1 Tax=Actinophytocola oryzae TaxID=502181 RepID=A0A4R7VVN2_9PSEU|nr:S8/S53 family peptidase [Actinophytocola oryzae]TDV54080.1 subtilase family protein [Actinophytocola oryzae]